MADLQVSNDVDRVTVGPDTIWMNSDGWVPLKLPDGAKGSVLFHDNGNGFAYLNGQIELSGVYARGTNTLLIPPTGYKFVSTSWHPGTDTSGSSNIRCYPLMGSQMVVGSNEMTATVTCVDGNLKAYFYSVMNQAEFSNKGVIYFSQHMTTGQYQGITAPALVGIEKV